ncbi:hypothetical protein D0Z08_06460 [Nocardioides immobilis]|uniref:Uncharacterized protein n=1 Tax=Nocardioides immobilis TaxID=2049295 RepID=A0A417Y616_9ACTN|nr:hypothetical protein [Nocardioides immobilis]RHW27924.1 hypothetical protein D0Z08_06460 [Nocardioides immobilis]
MADWEKLRELTYQVAPPDLASLARTARRRQRRARAFGVLAALVLVGGGIGVAAVGDTDRDTLQPAEDPTPTITDTPEDALPLPGRPPGADQVSVDAGRYRIPLSDTLAFEVDLPDETSAHDDGLFLATEDFVVKTEVAGDAYGVPRHPCTDQTIDPAGPTVDDLVQAISNLPLYQTTPPEPVVLGGAEGMYVEARIPRSYDASKCEGDAVQLPGNRETAVSGPPPYIGRWWILDVEGQRVVVQQNCWGCRPDQFDRAPQTPQSITFTPTS